MNTTETKSQTSSDLDAALALASAENSSPAINTRVSWPPRKPKIPLRSRHRRHQSQRQDNYRKNPVIQNALLASRMLCSRMLWRLQPETVVENDLPQE